ncbi:MAG: hypothetical protein H6Q65_1628 [Firmicutes bacterium]|nr:hypothetical protein [Bacillota bacterium]
MSDLETELKLKLLVPECGQQIAGTDILPGVDRVSAVQRDLLESQYYDTPSRRLQAARMAYRVRLEDGRWVATVKAGGSSEGGLHQREEYSVVLVDQEPSVAVFFATAIGERLHAVMGDEPLEAIFATRFTRYKRDLVVSDGSQIEFVVDLGEILAGGQKEMIAEVELELKKGSPSAVLTVGAELAKLFPVRVEPRSKYFRALQLAGMADTAKEDSSTTPAYRFHGKEPAQEELLRLLTALLIEVMNAEEQFSTYSEDPETLHQLRIALRRLRSALSFTKPLLAPEKYEQYQELLRQQGRETGYLREIDVTAASWQEVLRRKSFSVSGRFWLDEVLADERQAAWTKCSAALDKGAATALYLALWAWLAGEIERLEQVNQQNDQPLQVFVQGRVRDWLENILQMEKDLDFSDPDSLHALRILGKKLRYMLEIFSDLLDRTSKLTERLKKLQDGLGSIRDIQLTAELFKQWLQSRSSRALHRDAGLLMGWQACELQGRQAELWDDWQRFRKAARKWLKRNSEDRNHGTAHSG